MDYEADEGFVRRTFDLRCAACSHKWNERLEVTTFRSGDCVAKVVCPACEQVDESELLMEWINNEYVLVDWHDWDGYN
jgi:hypothetical protein